MLDTVVIYEILLYYLSLSCNYRVVLSSLCGLFWEPDIPCNLVSPWIYPVLDEIPLQAELFNDQGRYFEVIALICGIRRSRLSALWVGAAISGLLLKVLDLVRSGTPPIDPNGYYWTACPQTFMDLPGSGPYFHPTSSGQSMIRRVDLWRLLYLLVLEDDGLCYGSPPFSPWEPVGNSKEENCVLRVKSHQCCSRHHLFYEYWTWSLIGGTKAHDVGFECAWPESCPRLNELAFKARNRGTHPTMPLSKDQVASPEASIAIFEWVLAIGEGRPLSEPIYDDDWIAQCISDDEDLGTEGNADAAELPSIKTISSRSSDSNVGYADVGSRIDDWIEQVS